MIGAKLESARILIVDDEDWHVELLTEVLQDEGYRHIDAVADSRQAVRRYREFQPDLVILDLRMPGLSGQQVLAELRAIIPAETHLPILIVTADPTIEARREALAHGATDFILKPYDGSEIRARVRNLVETRLLHLQLRKEHAELEARVAERTGQLTAANGALQAEVDKRQRAQEALEKQREFLSAILENVHEGVVACDANGVLTLFNRATREFHGLPEEPIPAEQWAEHYDLFSSDGKTRLRKEEIPLFRALRGEQVRDATMVIAPHPIANARTVLASGRAFSNAAGEKLGAVVVMHDVTKRLHAEEVSRIANEKLQAIFDAAPLAILGMDPEGRILTWSAGAQRMFGWSAEETLGLVCPSVPEDGLQEFKRMISRTLTEGAQTGMVFPRQKKSGERIHASISAAPLHDTVGRPVGVMAILEDISDRVLAQEALQKAKDELEGRVLDRTAALTAVNQQLHSEIRERKQTQEALRESGEHLQAILDHSPSAIFLKDREGRYLLVNRRAAEVFHLSPTEIIGRTDHELVPREVADLYREHDRRVFESGLPISAEDNFPSQGEVLSHLTTKFPLTDANGSIYAVCGIATDVSALQEAERALRNSEERLRFTLDATGVGRWELDWETGAAQRSLRHDQIFGYEHSLPDWTYEIFLQHVHPDDRLRVETANKVAAEQGLGLEFECRIVRADGEERYIWAKGGPQGNGAHSGVVMDITPRKLAEKELQLRVAQVAAVAGLGQRALRRCGSSALFDEAVRLVAGTLDVEFSKILEIQPAGQSLLLRAGVGWKAGLVGHATVGAGRESQAGYTLLSDHPVIVGDLRTETRFSGPPLLHDHGIISGISVVIGTHDRPFGVLGAHSTRHRSFSDDDVHFLQAIANLLTAAIDQTSIEESLHEAKNDAERANRAKSEFLSRMSHELRTPMNAILGFAQVLEMNRLQGQPQECVAQILKAGTHLLGLINEVLDLSGIEAGRVSFSIEAVRVQDVARECIDLIRPLADARAVTLELPADDSPSHILADRQRLKQVLLNLLANAVKYNRDGGNAKVSWHEHGADRLRIYVEDSGTGIPADKLGQLFSPFERLGAELTATEGTGLGLALSKNLVKAMAGEIGVETVAGEGSTFWIDLPRSVSPLAQLSPKGLPPGLAATASAGTILYIEDNLSNLTLIEYLFSQRPQLKLLTAMQGRLGIDVARSQVPDLILLDLHLPDIMGDEVLAALKSDPATQHIPVVMLTADATPAQETRLRAAGVDDYLTKPLDVPRLLRLIEKTLGKNADETGIERTGASAEQHP